MTVISKCQLSRLVVAAAATCIGTGVHAAWEIRPEAEASVEANDNLRLQSDDTANIPDSSRSRLEGRLLLSNFTERGNITFEPRVRADSYSQVEHAALEGTDLFLRGRGQYEWERFVVGFRSNYDKQDVRDAEITDASPDDPDFDDPIDPDTGLVSGVDQDRERLLISPFTEIQLSERSALQLEARLMDVTYSQAQVTQRSNFEDREFSAGIIRRVDARNEVSARFYRSQYDAEQTQNTTDTIGVEGNFRRPLGRGWTFNLAAGVARSDYSFVNAQNVLVDNADTSFTYGLGFQQRTERNTLNIMLSRAQNPNSNGFLTLRDEVRIFLQRALNEKLTGSMAVRSYRTQTLDDVVANDQRDYARVEFELVWAMTERFFINGGYALATQEFQRPGSSDATSNMFFVGVEYRGLDRQQ